MAPNKRVTGDPDSSTGSIPEPSSSADASNDHHPTFVRVVKATDGAGHAVGLTPDGRVYTWGRTNNLGQLGRPTDNNTWSRSKKNKETSHQKASAPAGVPSLATLSVDENNNSNSEVRAVRAFVGGLTDSGHTAVLTSDGSLWLTGCDRWQQLGLGSPHAGAAGYTWKNGGAWRERFVRNDYLMNLMRDVVRDEGKTGSGNMTKKESTTTSGASATTTTTTSIIRDVAMGGDHTVILASNRKDVYTFGKGGEGQLGLLGKPFVSTPARSKELSSSKPDIAAVCAIRHCSATLDEEGHVLRTAGKCRMSARQMAHALDACRERASRDNLLVETKGREGE